MEKKQVALNKWFNVFVLFGLFGICLSVTAFNMDEKGMGIFFAFLALMGFAVSVFTEPCCYLFDSEGVTLKYVFYKKERYLWKNIHSVEVLYERGYNQPDFILISNYVFHIEGKVEGEERWYMKQDIRKSVRTKHLIEKYWDGTVTGYELENIRKKIEKWQGKKQKQIDAHFTDEVVKSEREARAKIRECAKPCIEKAKENNLDIKVNFYYVTSKGEELKSRPEDGYKYTVSAEVSHTGETDEDRIVAVDEDLIYVRFTKTGYKSTENKNSEKSFSDTLEEVIATICEKGIEFYCE